ncbi:efflux RND transporter periplasmic adaptor subunit [Siccirubricoccus sp. KC 17139]|uniref:Efflux RND transporter periplasmic adaptor subunit n=1 Tax=Siccirubricoccus soli TaxID=2899147 RepID=A0ABT1D0Z1_9PROT|nr:efflux RND transporter periplasmic adaptor subunit [Siccirubricoccus soli]MCO6414985.1 efflux RND transporter periplasmic adaptor subunit [Siccirubricoccus soli]MCP2681116.1 efflux RND transporter periplasmic adaptor subunit [Siccirubricoccus soli]
MLLTRFLLLLILLAGGGAAQAQFGPQGPPAVGVITAERRPVTESTEFTGRIEAVNRVDVRARVTGFLQERLFQEGQEVTAGDVLFRIEKPPFEAQLEQARANVASAQATLENARVSLARARELRQTGAGTQVNLDNAQAQERTANAQLLGAQAAVRVAEINLGYTDIISPIDGKIGRAILTPGNVVTPSLTEPLATIVSQDPMRVAFTVSSRAGLELRNRYESRGGVNAVVVRIRLTDGRVYPHAGRIDFIDTQVDRNTDSLLVRALIPNPKRTGVQAGAGDRELIDGQFVTVAVEGAEPVQAIVLPRAAVLQDQGGNYVLVVGEGNQAQRRGVRLGQALNENVVIEDGLQGGETVISEGLQRVRPGQPVNPSPAGEPPRPAGGAPGGAPAGGRQG